MVPLFIVNPVAGHGAANRQLGAIRAAFVGPAEVEYTAAPGDAARIAEKAGRRGFGPVVAVGGDGTVMNVVDGLMRLEAPPPIGIVPIGGGNDLARSLGISGDAVEATRRVWSDVCDPIDVGRCNEHFFLNVGGAGLDTDVALSVARSQSRLAHGRIGYLLHGVKLLSRYRNAEMRIQLDDEVVTTPALLVAVANGRYFAGGMKICPEAEVDDGMFDVCIAGDLSRLEAMTQIPMIYLGRHVRHAKVSVYRARRVRIEGPPGSEVQLDGEVVERLPAEFEVIPRGLRITGWSSARR